MNTHHHEILNLIKENANRPTQHTFSIGYLGNDHPKYSISNPILRLIAKEWMRDHKTMKADGVQKTNHKFGKRQKLDRENNGGYVIGFGVT